MFLFVPGFLMGSIPFLIVLIALFQKIEWRRHIKGNARSQFQNGAWTKFALSLIGIMILGTIISAIASVIPLLGVLVSLAVTGLVSYGTIDVLRKIRRGQEFEFSDFFSFDQLGIVMGLTLVKDIYLFLWGLLFVIPGIVKAFSYSQVYFIANENPGMGVDEIITESRAMMDGHKWELFVLQASFIGWAILGAFTFGIAVVYILPLYSMSMYIFHEYVKNGYLKSNTHKNVYTVY